MPPDELGYCYQDEHHFDETLARVARDHLVKRGRLFERLLPYVLAAWSIAALVTCVKLSPGAGVFAVVLMLIFVVSFFGRERRQMSRIEQSRLCFRCAYALASTPTDTEGRGVCPECGWRFHTAYYRRPPPSYVREPPPQ